MFTSDINPVLLALGPFEIRYYGLVYILGFFLVYWMFTRKRKELKITKKQAENLSILLLLGIVLGARFFSLIFPDPIGFLKDPLEFFRIWNGGMSFFGGLIGGFAVTYFYVRKHNMDWKKFADVAILPLAFALILGRLANFSNAELLGTPSNLPWCVVFTQVDNICRHPYQLYSGFLHVVLFSIMLIAHKARKLKPGALFFIFLTGYGILRLATGFFRDDPYRLFGLTLWQYGSIVLIILGIVYLISKKFSR